MIEILVYIGIAIFAVFWLISIFTKDTPKNKPNVVPQCACQGYGSVEAEEAHHRANISRARNEIDLHFAHAGMIEFTYRNRETHLERCIEFCQKDIELYPKLRAEWARKNPQYPSVGASSFQRLAIICEKQGNIDDAIKICELAISYNLKDSTKGGFQSRLSKLQKKKEKIIEDAPPAPIIVTVDTNALSKIRAEATETQNKLIVEDAETILPPSIEPPKNEPIAPIESGISGFIQSLEQIELDALLVILQGGNIDKFALDHGMFLNVLLDGINEKAYDAIGDAILDDTEIYPEYQGDLNHHFVEG